MSINHGTAGKTLRNKLLLIGGIAVGLGFLAWAVVRIFLPSFAPVAPFLGLLVVFKILGDKEISKALRAKSKGYIGEATVGKMLESLPSGWRVLHDLDLGGENVDHLVVGPAGAFNIEVKNYGGKVIATPKALYNKGKKQDTVVRQAWRQSHKLRELLGVEVVPILVFVGEELEGNRVGRLQVMRPGELVPHFKSLSRAWEYPQFLEVVGKAEKLVK